MMLAEKTTNSAETEAFAARLAETFSGGEVVLLHGEMGVGKTVFTKGLCRGLGVADYVTSPTFTVVNEYAGAHFPVYHFDMYRIEEEEELFEIGFEEYLQAGGVCIIEWPQNVAGALPCHRIEVTLTRADGEEERNIDVKRV